MKLITTGFYDVSSYEPIGLVQGISVHSISLFRGLFASISGTVGGKMPEIEKKYLDVRAEAIQELTAEAVKLGADCVVGLEVETTELNNYVVFIAAGTALKRKGSVSMKGGVRKPVKNATGPRKPLRKNKN